MPQVNSQLQVYYGWNLNYSLHQYRSLLNKILARSIRFQVSYHLHLWSQHSSLAADLHLATVNHASHRRSHTMLCFQKGNGGRGGEDTLHDGGRLIQCGHSSVQLHMGQIYYLGVLILQKSLKQASSIANAIWWASFYGEMHWEDGDKFSTFATSIIFFLSACWVEQCRKSLWVLVELNNAGNLSEC